MAQDGAPVTQQQSGGVSSQDVSNANALNQGVSEVRQQLQESSDTQVALLNSIAAAVTSDIIGGSTGSNDNRILVSKGTGGRALEASATTLDPSTGVITGATWQGTAIAANFGGTGIANNVANTVTFSGNFGITITLTNTTSVTIPTTGTLATLAGTEVFTNKTITYTAGTTGAAPINLTSGTNLTTAAAGAVEYDGTAFYATSVASSRQVARTEQLLCLSANYTLSNVNTAQQAFDGSANGAVTVAASTTYMFEALYIATNTGTTNHLWQTLFGGTATFTSGAYVADGRTATAANLYGTSGTVSTDTPGTALPVTTNSTSATENVTVHMRGVLRINAGGTLIPQIQLSAAPGGTQTMLANSYFRIWPIGSGSVVTIGNWS